jgi:hypothetical protein
VVPHLHREFNRQGLNEDIPEDWQNTLLRTASSPEMVAKLVDTFRQLARIGESTIVKAIIKAIDRGAVSLFDGGAVSLYFGGRG